MSITDHKTKDFLSKINLLIENGIIKNQAEVVDALNWNKSVMSSVKNGSLVVPKHIYTKFKETYSSELSALEKKPDTQVDWRDEKIAFLKEQNDFLKERLTHLEYQYKNYLSSEKLEAYLQANNALAGTVLDELLLHRAKMEKEKLQTLVEASDTKYDARLSSLRLDRS